MKKTLVTLLALVFVLGIAGTAFAAPANPFVDVPAKHWAYGAVAKLAKAGIVDGFGDGTFRGDRTMTRYEMAQVVAKAMAKSEKADAEQKALIDKLAVEFAAELNNLGVRVAKLEAKTNVKFDFESRIRYTGDDSKPIDRGGSKNFDFRQRIYLSGAVNDKIDYGARIQTDNIRFGENNSQSFYLNRMFFNIKDFAGIDKITIGRMPTLYYTLGLLSGSTNGVDGIGVTTKLGDQVTFKGYFIDPNSGAADSSGTHVYGNNSVAFGGFEFKTSPNVGFNLGYQQAKIGRIDSWPYAGNGTTWRTEGLKAKSLDVGAYGKIGDFYLKGEYVSTKVKSDTTASLIPEANPGVENTRKAYNIELSNSVTQYFAATTNLVDPMKAHTDAFAIGYKSIEHNATPVLSAYNGQLGYIGGQSGSTGGIANSVMAYDDNVKGWYFQYQNVLSKGLVFSFDYQDLKQKAGTGVNGEALKDKVWQGRFEFYF